MDFKKLKTFEEKKEFLLILLANSLILFLIVLSISTIVGINNKVKESHYIGRETQITVYGKGEVQAKPDLALINFGVKSEAKTVSEAMEENIQKMNNIISFIKNEGVEEKDLKTVNFRIQPLYEYIKDGVDYYLYPEGKRTLVGYEVSQSLETKIRNMDKIGSVIQGATDEGANQVGSLSFTIDDEEGLKKQAREEAIEKAKEKAKELASQLGVRLVKIVNFSESGTSPYYPVVYDSLEMAKGAGESSPQIEVGENTIGVNVSITYEIN